MSQKSTNTQTPLRPHSGKLLVNIYCGQYFRYNSIQCLRRLMMQSHEGPTKEVLARLVVSLEAAEYEPGSGLLPIDTETRFEDA